MLKPRTARLALLVTVVSAAVLATPALAQKPAAAPAPPNGDKLDKTIENAMESISPQRLKAHVEFLANDILEGRGTGERGGDIAAAYIASQFAQIGLGAAVPADANTTSYYQNVPLVGVTTDASQSAVAFSKDAQTVTTRYLEDAVFWSDTQQPVSEASSELVFVGYGALAPDYKWDDFKDVDLTGKVLLMLVNDPPSEDPALFGGKALTYYGRWTYKFWVAAEKGAAGAILIHNTDMAGYGWDVVRNSWGREQAMNAVDPQATPPLRLAGWVTEDLARQITALGGKDLAALMQQAASRDFRPVPLGVTASGRVTSKIRNFTTKNVVGFLPGTDPAKYLEFVILTAHYDHLGIGTPVDGDNIYNGAQDNASGVAALLEVARAFTYRGARPRRTLLFVAMSAEEQGLRGSEFFTNRRNLFILPGRMAGNVNLDGLSLVGQTRDYVFLGADRSPELNRIVGDASRLMGFAVKPDPHPEKGSYYRSDHFNFARIGVPAVSIDNGLDYADKPAGWGEEQYQLYLQKQYHQPDDEFDPAWDYKGLEQISRIAFYVGWRIGMENVMANWNPGDEFAEERKEALDEVPPAEAPKP